MMCKHLIYILTFYLPFQLISSSSPNPSQGTIPNTPTLNITPPPTPHQHQQHLANPPKQTLLSKLKQPQPQSQLPQNKPAFPLSDHIVPLKPSTTTERILTQAQPSKVMQGTVDGQQVHYQKTYAQQTIQLQVYKIRQIDLNYQHIKTYAFQLQNTGQYHIKVQHDTEIKGTFMLYWENNGAYSQSRYEGGQELQFSVFLNRQSLLVHQTCYHTTGFKFFAQKGNTYTLFFKSQGYKKLVSLVMENYMSEKSGGGKLSTQHADEHEMATEKIKNTLRTFYGVVEKNFMMNQQIAYNVSLHSKRYMSYQIVEMMMVILGACVQIYLIRKLLNPQSVI